MCVKIQKSLKGKINFNKLLALLKDCVNFRDEDLCVNI